MRVATCQFCQERIQYMVDPMRLDRLGRWMHAKDGVRKCCGGKQTALPESGTVKMSVEDVQVKGGRV